MENFNIDAYLTPSEDVGKNFPYANYNVNGDCIEFFLSADQFYGERIDDLITVYVSEETGKPVGGLLKGVQGFIERLNEKKFGTRHDFSGSKFKLEYLLTAGIWFSDNQSEEEHVKLVLELREATKKSNLEAECCSASSV